MSITGYTGSEENITIPDAIDGRPVTSIEDYAFVESAIHSINISAGIVEIGVNAFNHATYLTAINVDLDNPNYSSHSGILYNKQMTTLIRCPCGKVGSLSLPNELMHIEDGGFSYCTYVTGITIGNNLVTIGNNTFEYCSYLASLSFGSELIYIGEGAFRGCIALTEIAVAPENSFYASSSGILFNKDMTLLICCPGGTKGTIAIRDNVTTIGHHAFAGCSKLKSVDIPPSVQIIGDCAFYECSSLNSVTNGSGVVTIGECAFGYCSSLWWFVIPEGVTEIREHTFTGCASISTVTIPSTVTRIMLGAFENCVYLQTINIPNSVRTIGDFSFFNCDSLINVTIPEGVTYIGVDAFYDCSSLTSVSISSSVSEIALSPFNYCEALTDIQVDANNSWYSSNGGILYDKTMTKLLLCPMGISGSVIIPEGVTQIREHSFSECFGITSVTIPASATLVGDYAFHLCTSLTSIHFLGEEPECGESWIDHTSEDLVIYYHDGSSMHPNREDFPVVLAIVIVGMLLISIGLLWFYRKRR